MKKVIQDKIAELLAEMDSMDVTLDESLEAAEKMSEFFRDGASGIKKAAESGIDLISMMEKARLSQIADEIEMLQETLKKDLIEVTTKYVITDDDGLISPAGFHPETGVIIKPANICILTDRLPRHLSSNLKAFTINRDAH